MKIGIASDHAALALKNRLRDQLANGDTRWRNSQPPAPTRSTTDYAHTLAGGLQRGELERGVLICRHRLGMSMAANATAASARPSAPTPSPRAWPPAQRRQRPLLGARILCAPSTPSRSSASSSDTPLRGHATLAARGEISCRKAG